MQVHAKINSIKKFYKEDIHTIPHKFQKSAIHLSGAACIGSFLVGTGKLYIAFLSLSFFTFISALYTYAIVCAKVYILYGLSQSKNNIIKQFHYYKCSGIFLIIAGIAYILYAIQLYQNPVISNFNLSMALSIAFFTFVELGLNIRGIIVERKNAIPLFHALKIVNLASSCICLVLTQTALLAYTSAQIAVSYDARSNGLIGILMGIVSVLLGVYIVLRVKRIMSGKDHQKLCKKMGDFMKKQQIEVSIDMKSIYMRNDGNRVMEVTFQNPIEEATKRQLYFDVLNKLNIVIFDKHDTIRKKEILQ